MSTTNRVAVVTGGGSGIGQAIAAHLARNGRQVAVLTSMAKPRKRWSASYRPMVPVPSPFSSTFPIQTPSLKPSRRCEIRSVPPRSL